MGSQGTCLDRSDDIPGVTFYGRVRQLSAANGALLLTRATA
nr:hypothetical protein [Synechococcus sp. AH-551-C10]